MRHDRALLVIAAVAPRPGGEVDVGADVERAGQVLLVEEVVLALERLVAGVRGLARSCPHGRVAVIDALVVVPGVGLLGGAIVVENSGFGVPKPSGPWQATHSSL